MRWARILRALGLRVTVATAYRDEPCDTMLALHARRSYAALAAFRARHPAAPLILALTGTDLYGDIQRDADARHALELADRLVVLQPKALEELAPALHPKVRLIYQSVPRPRAAPPPARRTFDVAVIGHLRPVKAPFLAAEAVRDLPSASRIRVVHAGGALEPEMAQAAQAEMARNPRYRWLGEQPRWKAMRLLMRSRVLVLSSRSEGGANVLSEAMVAGVPALVTDVPGNVGMLGEGYPGCFPVGDAAALRALLLRCEAEPAFLAALRAWGDRLAPRFEPARERQAWADLLAGL